jgi:hypothetical protein
MPCGPNRPRPEPEHVRVRSSGGSKSGRRAIRRRGSGDGSAVNRGARSSGCWGSRGFPPPGLRSTRRRTRKRGRMGMMGVGLPPRGGSLRPPRPELRRRWKRRRLGRVRERPPPGILRERRRAPRRCRRMPRRWLGVRRQPHRRRRQRPPSPRGKGNEGFPP